MAHRSPKRKRGGRRNFPRLRVGLRSYTLWRIGREQSGLGKIDVVKASMATSLNHVARMRSPGDNQESQYTKPRRAGINAGHPLPTACRRDGLRPKGTIWRTIKLKWTIVPHI